jgi:hypothetical protein
LQRPRLLQRCKTIVQFFPGRFQRGRQGLDVLFPFFQRFPQLVRGAFFQTNPIHQGQLFHSPFLFFRGQCLQY